MKKNKIEKQFENFGISLDSNSSNFYLQFTESVNRIQIKNFIPRQMSLKLHRSFGIVKIKSIITFLLRPIIEDIPNIMLQPKIASLSKKLPHKSHSLFCFFIGILWQQPLTNNAYTEPI